MCVGGGGCYDLEVKSQRIRFLSQPQNDFELIKTKEIIYCNKNGYFELLFIMKKVCPRSLVKIFFFSMTDLKVCFKKMLAESYQSCTWYE